MAAFVPSNVFIQKILADINTALTGALVDAAVGLFSSNTVITADTILADLTPADYTGAGNEDVTWLAVSIAPDGSYEITGTVPEFRPTDAVSPEQEYGWYLLGVGGIFLGAGRFDDPPLPMESASNHILITPRLQVSPSGDFAIVV